MLSNQNSDQYYRLYRLEERKSVVRHAYLSYKLEDWKSVVRHAYLFHTVKISPVSEYEMMLPIQKHIVGERGQT